MNSRLLCLIALFSVLATGCSRHQQIVLSNHDGSHQLVYDADAFSPQARTGDDISVLMNAAGQIMQADPDDVVTAASLRSAMFPPPGGFSDYKQLERIIYDYRVAQLKASNPK